MTGDRILITGASGSLGKQLIYELDRKGVKPITHVRETSDTTYIDSLGLEKRFADLRNKKEVNMLVEGINSIIHTAAWVNFRRDQQTRFSDINTSATVSLFQAARQAGIKRFVHVSTVAAIGALPRGAKGEHRTPGADSRANEETPFNLDHLHIPYIITKRAAEQELLKSTSGSSTDLVIVNPSIVVAPSRTGDDRGKALRKFPRFLAPGFPNRINLVDIRDVAPGVIAALRKGRAGERYILAGDNISATELVLTLSAILHRAPHLTRVPRAALNFAARCSLILGKLPGRRKISFYPDLVKMLDYDWTYSSAKARRELGYTSRSIHITLDDLLNNNFVGSHARPE